MRLKVRAVKKPDRVLSYWLAQKMVVAAVFISGILFNTMTVLVPVLQGRLIDLVVAKSAVHMIFPAVIRFIAIVLLVQTFRFIKRFYVRRFANIASASMRLTVYRNILSRGAAEEAGDLMTRAISDVELCVEGMRKFTTEIFDTGVLMLSYLVGMLVYNAPLAVIACLFVPVAMKLADHLKTVVYRRLSAFREQASRVSTLTYEIVGNHMTLRTAGLATHWESKYAKELEELRKRSVYAGILENAMQPVYFMIASLSIPAVILLGGRLVLRGQWSPGDFSAFLTMFLALTTKAGKAGKLFNSVQKSQVSWRRIKPYLSENPELPEEKYPLPEDAPLRAKDLMVSYEPGNKPVLEGVTFSAKPGEIVAVTGPIASGKSSLALALAGLCPSEGQMLIGEESLADMPESKRAARVAWMGHDPHLLSDTIENNIRIGREGDVSQVLREVCFDRDLESMPKGIQTKVGSSGVRLSGGQQARIALARALFAHTPVIVLDDPFAALDLKTECEIFSNLRRFHSDSIIFLFSHRLTLFPVSDQVMLIESGRVAAYGTHQEVLDQSKLYRRIFELQQKEEGAK